MNKVQTKSWKEAREELARIASAEDCKAFDQALVEDRKVTAVRHLRRFNISVYTG